MEVRVCVCTLCLCVCVFGGKKSVALRLIFSCIFANLAIIKVAIIKSLFWLCVACVCVLVPKAKQVHNSPTPNPMCHAYDLLKCQGQSDNQETRQQGKNNRVFGWVGGLEWPGLGWAGWVGGEG